MTNSFLHKFQNIDEKNKDEICSTVWIIKLQVSPIFYPYRFHNLLVKATDSTVVLDSWHILVHPELCSPSHSGHTVLVTTALAYQTKSVSDHSIKEKIFNKCIESYLSIFDEIFGCWKFDLISALKHKSSWKDTVNPSTLCMNASCLDERDGACATAFGSASFLIASNLNGDDWIL